MKYGAGQMMAPTEEMNTPQAMRRGLLTERPKREMRMRMEMNPSFSIPLIRSSCPTEKEYFFWSSGRTPSV